MCHPLIQAAQCLYQACSTSVITVRPRASRQLLQESFSEFRRSTGETQRGRPGVHICVASCRDAVEFQTDFGRIRLLTFLRSNAMIA